jgi:PKD repeat protein
MTSTERDMGAAIRALGRAGRIATAGVACALGLAPAAHAQAPVASFTYAPDAPWTGDLVTFTSSASGAILLQRWDLDNDGEFDDGTEPTVTTTFRTAGRHTVRLEVIGASGSGAVQSQVVTVANRPPTASFSYAPAPPTPGEPVTFQSTASDPEGQVAYQAWDLDGDGAFDDATGGSASRAFLAPGDYTVSLQTVDADGGASTTTQTVSVPEPPPTLLSPFPVVRMVGRPTRTGVRVLRLTVRAPEGARVELECLGRACGVGVRRASATVPSGSEALRFRRFERRLGAGAQLKIRVTRPGRIGKYTRFLVRRRGVPLRRDLCLVAGSAPPIRCPS